jgi:hypothetical protein
MRQNMLGVSRDWFNHLVIRTFTPFEAEHLRGSLKRRDSIIAMSSQISYALDWLFPMRSLCDVQKTTVYVAIAVAVAIAIVVKMKGFARRHFFDQGF